MVRKYRLLIGVALVVTVTATAAVGYRFVGSAGKGSQSGYCALMADAVGLYVGNPVTQMGYRVGQVDSVRPEGDHVAVSFSLDNERAYPADVKAVTRSKSVLADRSLELVGNYQAGPRLAPGQCIARKDTATPKSLAEITGSVADFIDHVAPGVDTRNVELAVDGLARALADNGDPTRRLMQNAAQAMASPDRMVSDIGAILFHAAPLSTEALAQWSTIRSTLDMMPGGLTAATYGLWPGVEDLLRGIGPLVAVLYEIQTQYGDIIWPMADSLADIIHLAATRSEDIKGLLESVPPIAALLGKASRNENVVQFLPPTVKVGVPNGQQMCDVLNVAIPGSCSSDGGALDIVGVNLLDLVIAKKGR
ncbi:MlaD family protein [Nocardia sp. NPDC055029]